MKSCCIEPPAILEGGQEDPPKAPQGGAPRSSQDIALLKFFLLLQVSGERKAEIEKLLLGAVGFKPHKDSKSHSDANQRLHDDSHPATAAAEADQHHHQHKSSTTSYLSKRSSLTKRWRKSSVKKKGGGSSEEDHHNATSPTKSSNSTGSSCDSSSSVKSAHSSPSPSHDAQPQQIPNANTCNVPSNGRLNMDASDMAFANDCVVGDSDMSMLQRLALNALNLTAPASSVLLNNRRNNWIQLSGHPGSLAPAGPGTIWKKRGPEPVETEAYKALATDPAREITPTFFREIKYQEEYFIEMADLLYSFNNPCVMDIKMGTRTFLETEVSNTTARHDLYEKMIKVDASAPSSKESEEKAVTKLRYMDFRDNMSSSRSLGFRIEALKMSGSDAITELQTVRSREEVANIMTGFLKGRESTKRQIIERLHHLRKVFVNSPFFQGHEVIGSSILIIYDDDKAGVWMIDFAKTVPLPSGMKVTHTKPWELGNHEEGYLFGIDNLLRVVDEVPVTKTKKLGLFCTP
ncbi:inositol-trisphosphate 3-kinase homolog isoform X1 [Macrobrachium nipponense]|uniref:inositol-trisphosphate 3-kinase homolog isoform X1 n=1 Tax=Macrobrachium nipponense TaxID=159736 RepID=UPI0030C83D9F